MDLYHSIVFVGACIAFFAMYKAAILVHQPSLLRAQGRSS